MPSDIVFQPAGQLLTEANPAAGALPVGLTVPAGVRDQLLVVRFQLVTSATVANRNIYLNAARGGTTYWSSGANSAQAASLTNINTVTFGAPIAAQNQGNGNFYLGLNALTLAPGDVLSWSHVGLQAADQISAVTYIVGVL